MYFLLLGISHGIYIALLVHSNLESIKYRLKLRVYFIERKEDGKIEYLRTY